jgi:hypothetical protein
MNKLHTIAAGLVLGASTLAAHALEAEFTGVPPRAIAIGEISTGEVLAAKADEYGEKDIALLKDTLRADLERELGRIGRLAEGGAADAVLDIVLEDALPNQPTAKQQTASPQPLDPRSVFVGGAHVSAVLAGGDGQALGRFDYEWQTRPDIRQAEYATTWTDARRTLQKFASQLADAIAAEGGGSG